MQPQTSTAPAVSPPRSPQPVPRPEKPRERRIWLWLTLIVIFGSLAAGALYWRRSAATPAAAKTAAFRTAVVSTGSVERTLRLSGATGAERFVSLVSPQLRGSRSGFGRDNNSTGGGSSPTTSVQAKQGGNASAASSSGNASGTPNMSSGLRAATSRLSTPRTPGTSTTTGSSSASGSAASASSSLGSDGLGSTSGSLFSSTGGGGGGGDFNLVLQKVVKPGSTVKKGEVVAEFDRQYMLQRLEDYQASVVQAEASLTKLKADLQISKKAKEQDIATAKGALDKARLDMKTLPVLSDLDAERAKLALSEAEATYKRVSGDLKDLETSQRAQVRDAELELEQSKLELKRAEMNADRMILKTPIDGLTVMQTVPRGGELAQAQEGDQLWPGMMFMSIVDPRSMVINSSVNQVDVERIRIGQKAWVRFDAYPDLRLPARIYSVGGVPKQGGQRATFVKEIAVRLKLEQMDPRVIPDLSVSADVVLDSEQNAAVVPLASIFRDESTGRPFVWAQSGQAWTRRDVELGVTNNVAVAVRSGLKPGETVALDAPPKQAASEATGQIAK